MNHSETRLINFEGKKPRQLRKEEGGGLWVKSTRTRGDLLGRENRGTGTSTCPASGEVDLTVPRAGGPPKTSRRCRVVREENEESWCRTKGSRRTKGSQSEDRKTRYHWEGSFPEVLNRGKWRVSDRGFNGGREDYCHSPDLQRVRGY